VELCRCGRNLGCWSAGVLGCWGAGTSVHRSKRCAAGVGVYFRRKLPIPRDLDFANAARPFVPSHQVPSHQVPSHQVLKKRVRISQRHASTLNNNHVSANPKVKASVSDHTVVVPPAGPPSWESQRPFQAFNGAYLNFSLHLSTVLTLRTYS
jgi:hypothetical protein